MFEKKCNHCNKKVKRDFEFCPYCANPLKDRKKDYGLLGKNDDDPTSLVAKESSSIMDKIIGSTVSSVMKMFEKEMGNSSKLENNPMKISPGLQLYVNGQRIPIQTGGKNSNENVEEKNQKSKPPKISDEVLKNSVKLPRKEAKTKLTRLKDRVIYQLETPGIESLNNIVVNQLENSIEVKAYTKKAVYMKTLKVKLQLMSYSFKEDSVFLEFKAN